MNHKERIPSAELTPRKRKLFLSVVVLVPVLFFVILELFMRLINFGPDLSLFKVEMVNGKPFYTLNPSVKNRYFNKVEFTPDPSPEYFPVSKPEGSYRIFFLGGSTTVGYPYWYNGSFSSFLRDRLQWEFPGREIEIVNVGMTATGSYTVLDLTDDLMNYQPDLLVVYDGHNEFYGALGAASNDRVASARWMTLLYLRVEHLRTFQLMKAAVSWLSQLFGNAHSGTLNRATMMEQVARGEKVAFGSDIYCRALDNFKSNLEDTRRICESHGVPIIFGTQASNLRDQSPFISENIPGLTAGQRASFEDAYRGGLKFQLNDTEDSAAASFEKAILIDSLYADAHYRLAQCLDKQGRMNEARREYIKARDLDELRFRTDSRFNDLIRAMDDNKHFFVADIEKALERSSRDSIIGREVMLEHLHPNAWGNFLIAREYTEVMRAHGLVATKNESSSRNLISEDSLWKDRHVTEIDELMAERKIEYLTSGWPFKSKTTIVANIPPGDTLRYLADQAVHDRIGWVTAHQAAAAFYVQRHNPAGAVREYETIISQLPLEPQFYVTLARLFYDQKDLARTESLLRTSLGISPTSAAYRALGDVYMKTGRTDAAISCYEEMHNRPQDAEVEPENDCILALAYLMVGRQNEAIEILHETIRRYPSYPMAHRLLAKALQQRGH